jgi:hypothetical protein
MLPNILTAQKLGFINSQTRKPATAEEIATEFEGLRKQVKGLKATGYKAHCKLELPGQAIETLLDSRIEQFKTELRLHFPKFDKYPLSAQFALLDLAFNLGTRGLVNKFPSFRKAVEAGDWERAAKESNRPQVSALRNATVRKWLEEAGTGK